MVGQKAMSAEDPLGQARMATLHALLEVMFPADEVGAGAGELGAPAFFERGLEGALAPFAQEYRDGLDSLDERARVDVGDSFAALPPSAQELVLTAFDAEGTPGRDFIDLVNAHLYDALLGDPAHGGNVDCEGWRIFGMPGPRRTITPEEQELDALPSQAPASTYDDPMFSGRARR